MLFHNIINCLCQDDGFKTVRSECVLDLNSKYVCVYVEILQATEMSEHPTTAKQSQVVDSFFYNDNYHFE